MSLSVNEDPQKPVHFPADPDKFVFDNEVTAIFPNMAKRSIPHFYEAHAMHARMLAAWVQRPGLQIADFGASRGAFIDALRNCYGPGIVKHVCAADISDSMCSHLEADFPDARVHRMDITSAEFLSDDNRSSFDIINLNYVLQFVPPTLQDCVLTKILDMVKPGGVLIYGTKEDDNTPLGALLHEQYIQFRLDNGYTREEIVAKSAALKNSMWPTNRLWFLGRLASSGFSVRETTRYAVFATYFAIRDGGNHGAG